MDILDSVNFINPDTGVCTNAAEAYWSRLKRFARRKQTMASVNNLSSYLDEFMWREHYDSGNPMSTMNYVITHLSQWDRYGFN